MKFTVDWDDREQTILCGTYEGAWVFEEYLASLDEGVSLMRSVDHRVDVIVHTLDAAAQTPSIWALRSWRYAVMNSPPNAGLTVIFPGNASVRAFATALSHLAGAHYEGKIITANTLDEARLVIRQARNR